jgi:thiamine-phosphate pyrophosphorylase
MPDRNADHTGEQPPPAREEACQALRIADAAANRSSEGLRVVEDYVRFVLDDAYLTELAKRLRHELAAAAAALPYAERAAMRDTRHDVGTNISTPSEARRHDSWEVCQASFARTKQALRSLEEFGKTTDFGKTIEARFASDPHFAETIEALRYRLYTLEKAVAVLHDSRQRLQGVSLCVLIDGQASHEQFSALVAQLVDANVGMIQLRDKRLSDQALIERARCLTAIGLPNQAQRPLILINDRPDIAAAAGADGVHLGQDDLSVKDARGILGPRKLIGVSTHSIQQARTAVLDGANYLGAGPTFRSPTKSFDQFPGLDYLRQVAAEISLPSFAIGGIDGENMRQVLAAGATRVAVSSAVAAAPNPGSAASKLLRILSAAAAPQVEPA